MSSLYAGYPDRAALDAAYDVENSVPDFMVFAEKFMADAASARAALNPREDVPYGTTLMETVEVYPAAGDAPAPIFVFIHGGYWKSLRASVFSGVAPGPVAAGMAVVNVTYDLCPVVTIDEIVRQVRAAIAWTWRNAESFGGDRNRIIVAGHSAGGHLTAMAMLTDWSRYGLPDDVVKAGVAISGLFDLEPLSFSWIQQDLRLTAETIRWQSPINLVKPVGAPLAVARGDADPSAFAGQSERFAAAWKAAGNEVTTFVIENANHFEVLDGFLIADGIMTRTLLDLVRKIS